MSFFFSEKRLQVEKRPRQFAVQVEKSERQFAEQKNLQNRLIKRNLQNKTFRNPHCCLAIKMNSKLTFILCFEQLGHVVWHSQRIWKW